MYGTDCRRVPLYLFPVLFFVFYSSGYGCMGWRGHCQRHVNTASTCAQGEEHSALTRSAEHHTLTVL